MLANPRLVCQLVTLHGAEIGFWLQSTQPSYVNTVFSVTIIRCLPYTDIKEIKFPSSNIYFEVY